MDKLGDSSSTKILKEEHKVILSVLEVLGKILRRGNEGGEVDYAGIEKCVRFFKLFADACHHGKEEDILFPELEAKGIPRHGGPIGMMIYEHELGRSLVRKMRDSLESALKGNIEARGSLFEAGWSYINLLRSHIGKEDECLFSMADSVMDFQSCKKVCDAYSKTCKKFEGHTRKQLESLAGELVERYRG